MENKLITPERLAEFFHENYESLAMKFNYKTRDESNVPWAEVPENNKKLMMAVCDMVIKTFLEPKFCWQKYNFNDISSRPKLTGKYFIHRKDGKVHWETWNGSGWAYNNTVITHYMQIKLPINK